MLKVLFQQTWRSAAAKMYPNYTAMKTVKIQTILPLPLFPSTHDVNMSFSLTEEPFLLLKMRMSDEHKLNQRFPSSEVKNVCRNEVMTPARALDGAAVLGERLPVNPGIGPELMGAAGAPGTRGDSLGNEASLTVSLLGCCVVSTHHLNIIIYQNLTTQRRHHRRTHSHGCVYVCVSR